MTMMTSKWRWRLHLSSRESQVAQAWANRQTVLTYISHSHPELEHMQAVYATSKYV